MGRTCGTYGEKMIARRAFLGKTEGKDHLQDVGVDGRIMWE
jgi:hypothetical protein